MYIFDDYGSLIGGLYFSCVEDAILSIHEKYDVARINFSRIRTKNFTYVVSIRYYIGEGDTRTTFDHSPILHKYEKFSPK